jgi:hypothetical protein
MQGWPTMIRASDQLTVSGVLREHRFESHTPVLGSFIVRLRAAWYNVAARWGDQAIINQQVAYNQAVAQRITELDQHIAEHDQRLILADRDLTDLTCTVAELTQQVIELRHSIEELQTARTKF